MNISVSHILSLRIWLVGQSLTPVLKIRSLEASGMLTGAETTGDSVEWNKVVVFGMCVRFPFQSPPCFPCVAPGSSLSMRNASTPFVLFTWLTLAGHTRPAGQHYSSCWTTFEHSLAMFDLGLCHARSHAQSKQRFPDH